MSGSDLTILVALAAGLLSFLSPCVLPLVPAYIGQLTAIAVAAGEPGARPSRWMAVRQSLAYVAGFGAVFTILGITATFMAGPLADYLAALRDRRRRAAHRARPQPRRDPPHPGPRADVAAPGGRRVGLAGDGHRDRGPRLRERVGHGQRRRPDGRPHGQPARRLDRVVRARGDLRGRLDPVHRHHPRGDPDDGRDLGHDRPGRRSCCSPTRSGSGSRSSASRSSTTARRGSSARWCSMGRRSRSSAGSWSPSSASRWCWTCCRTCRATSRSTRPSR